MQQFKLLDAEQCLVRVSRDLGVSFSKASQSLSDLSVVLRFKTAGASSKLSNFSNLHKPEGEDIRSIHRLAPHGQCPARV